MQDHILEHDGDILDRELVTVFANAKMKQPTLPLQNEVYNVKMKHSIYQLVKYANIFNDL